MTRTFWTLLDIACPFCRADVGEKCKIASGPGAGRPLAIFHVGRRVEFRVARAAEDLLAEAASGR